MKIVSLSISERLQLVAFLNSFQEKSFETLTHVWSLLEKAAIKEEEKNAIELKIDGPSLVWNKEKAKNIDVEFSPDEEKVFNEEFEIRSRENKLDVTQYNLAQVFIKLKDVK
jgi:hypothetical protein